ncbi:MAG: DUF2807 domain-containing protein [Bacteroidales bacterium]|nr:DUF2807 domain-containing protein [Bacteroidales bacterium]
MKTTKNLILLGLLIISLSGCHYHYDYKIHGRGEMITEERDVRSFVEIDSRIAADIYITQDEGHYLTIEAQENILDILITDVIGDRLILDYSRDRVEHDGINIYVTMETLEKIKISGAGDVEVEDPIICDLLELEVDGAGDMYFNSVVANEIYVTLSGAGNFEFAGPDIVEYMDIELSGVGHIDAYDLQVEKVVINSSGTGDCKLNVIDELDIQISGVGSVFYKGDPEVTSSISGLGTIKQIDD